MFFNRVLSSLRKTLKAGLWWAQDERHVVSFYEVCIPGFALEKAIPYSTRMQAAEALHCFATQKRVDPRVPLLYV